FGTLLASASESGCTNGALELVLRTIMEIRAYPILLAAMPLRAISGVSSRMRREDQFSISSLSLADLGGETIAGSHAVSGNHRHCAAGFRCLIETASPLMTSAAESAMVRRVDSRTGHHGPRIFG